MWEYILIIETEDYHEMGGGLEYFEIDTLSDLDKKVNDELSDSRKKVVYCAQIKDKVNFKPVTHVTKWQIDDQYT